MCYKWVAVPFPTAYLKTIHTMQCVFYVVKKYLGKDRCNSCDTLCMSRLLDSLELSSTKWYCCCHNPYMTIHSTESQAAFFGFFLKLLDKILAPVKSSQNKNYHGPEMGPGFSHEEKINPVLLPHWHLIQHFSFC